VEGGGRLWKANWGRVKGGQVLFFRDGKVLIYFRGEGRDDTPAFWETEYLRGKGKQEGISEKGRPGVMSGRKEVWSRFKR